MACPGWIIVTGGNTGIGFETCKKLAVSGYKVILCSRDKTKGEAAVQLIRDSSPGVQIDLMIIDISDMDSVRKFVSDFTVTGKELAVLVNNAGMLTSFMDRTRYSTGPHNWEITMTTNHLGPFLLTNLLIPCLKKYAETHGAARIVVVASSITERKSKNPFDVADIMYDKPGSYSNGGDAYRNSKAANVMFTSELSRRLDQSGVTVNCLCPGFIPTSDLARSHGTVAQWLMTKVVGGFIGTKIFRIPAVTLGVGAERIIDLAVGDAGKGVSGLYFKNGAQAEPAEYTRDAEKQHQLWETSARLTGLA